MNSGYISVDDFCEHTFVAYLGEARCYSTVGRGFDLAFVYDANYGPGVDSSSNRNEYQESSWGKGRPTPCSA
jgi:hypothetical protein